MGQLLTCQLCCTREGYVRELSPERQAAGRDGQRSGDRAEVGRRRQRGGGSRASALLATQARAQLLPLSWAPRRQACTEHESARRSPASSPAVAGRPAAWSWLRGAREPRARLQRCGAHVVGIHCSPAARREWGGRHEGEPGGAPHLGGPRERRAARAAWPWRGARAGGAWRRCAGRPAWPWRGRAWQTARQESEGGQGSVTRGKGVSAQPRGQPGTERASWHSLTSGREAL